MSSFSDRLRELQQRKAQEAEERISALEHEANRRAAFFDHMVFALLGEMRQTGIVFANGYGLATMNFYRQHLYGGTLEGGVRIPIRNSATIMLQLDGTTDLSIVASVAITAEAPRVDGWDSLRAPGPPNPPRYDNRQRCYTRAELETWMLNRIGELDLTVVRRPPRGTRGVQPQPQAPRPAGHNPDARTRAIDLRNYDAGPESQKE